MYIYAEDDNVWTFGRTLGSLRRIDFTLVPDDFPGSPRVERHRLGLGSSIGFDIIQNFHASWQAKNENSQLQRLEARRRWD